MEKMKYCRRLLAGVAVCGFLAASGWAAVEIEHGQFDWITVKAADLHVRTLTSLEAQTGAAADNLTGAGALVHKNPWSLGLEGDGDINQTYAFSSAWTNWHPDGVFFAQDLTLMAGHPGVFTGVQAWVFRSTRVDVLDGDVAEMDIVLTLWDGDPLGAFDTAAGGFSGAPIPGATATIPGIRLTGDGTRQLGVNVFNLVGDFAAPVSFSPVDDRVWMVMTSNTGGCRLAWLISTTTPTIGQPSPLGPLHCAPESSLAGSACTVDADCVDGACRPSGVWEQRQDTDGSFNGQGTCCNDGTACDVNGPADDGVGGVYCLDDSTGSAQFCTDGDAENARILSTFGPCGPDSATSSCSTFTAGVYGQARVAMAWVPTSNVPYGTLDAGAAISGNEITMESGDTDVIWDIVLTDWSPNDDTCSAGPNVGQACTSDGDCPDDPTTGCPGVCAGDALKAYQAVLDSGSYTTGLAGELTVSQIACPGGAADCAAAIGGACTLSRERCSVNGDCPLSDPPFNETCSGPSCVSGFCRYAFINTLRTDFPVPDPVDALPVVDISTPDFRWASALQPGVCSLISPDPFFENDAYLGNLITYVPPDAKGTFTMTFIPPGSSNVVNDANVTVDLLGFKPGKLTVQTGQCCDLASTCTTDDDCTIGEGVCGGQFCCLGSNYTKSQCEDIIGGSFTAGATCADECGCTEDAQCADGDACTVDRCVDASCSNTAVTLTGTQCCDPLDGDDINGGGAITDNFDGQVCTDDICDAADTCAVGAQCGVAANPANTADCDDGNVCTYGDVCNGTDVTDDVACAGIDIEGAQISCSTIDDCPDGSTGCSQDNLCECKLDVDLICGTTDDACAEEGDKVTFNIERGPGQTVCGAQFAVAYPTDCLAFDSMIPGGGVWVTELDEAVDEAAGVIFYAVGVDPFGGVCSGAAGVLAQITFTKLGTCNCCEISCSLGVNPMNSIMVDAAGQPVGVNPLPGDEVCDNPGISLEVPDNVEVNADCDFPTAYVYWDPPVTGADCPEDVDLDCIGWHDSGLDMTANAMTGGEHPLGVTTYECTASALLCEQKVDVKRWTVTVNDMTTLDVTVQLSPQLWNPELHRCITFEMYSDCVQAPLVFKKDLVFGGLWDHIGHFTDTVKIPTSGQWVCITARDQLHSLRSCDFLECVDGVYSAIFKGDPFFGGNWLINGNLDGWKKFNPNASHDVIDILDFGQFVAQYMTWADVDIFCELNDEGPHADINGDGLVDELDYAFVQMNFLSSSKECCCGVGTMATVALTEISVAELRQKGLDDLTVADLNRDGMLNADDMNAFMAGATPERKDPRSRSSLRSQR